MFTSSFNVNSRQKKFCLRLHSSRCSPFGVPAAPPPVFGVPKSQAFNFPSVPVSTGAPAFGASSTSAHLGSTFGASSTSAYLGSSNMSTATQNAPCFGSSFGSNTPSTPAFRGKYATDITILVIGFSFTHSAVNNQCTGSGGTVTAPHAPRHYAGNKVLADGKLALKSATEVETKKSHEE
ncbi:hypothetical protein Cgig2_015338 [Carnegiea gigantea]|uniref:Uncharacterized protein n=1 Tax=Carnegiea gigantea TaxID=171969 RepID=A0A9Q1GV25_9CARY|nr:hypothetical protein Cgig2_015338 [Carnegiea gigantea]